ncbi:MAG: histidine phosphatase family protein [Rhizobiaceae bacterium]
MADGPGAHVAGLPLLYVVRHGQTGWNAELRLQGQADTDLSALGRTQAARNGRRLAELVADPGRFDFVASPLRRTRETMEIVRAAMGLRPQGYRTDPRLMELSFGDWQGHTMPEIEALYPGSTERRMAAKWTFRPPGAKAESYAMLLDRVRPWLAALTQPTICCAHGGIVRVLFRLIANMPEAEAADLDALQDRVLRIEGGRLEWL